MLPTSTASSIVHGRRDPCSRVPAVRARPCSANVERRTRLPVVGQRLAHALGERLGGQLRLVALAAELLDREVARRVHLGARDHPRRPVLVPDPHVLHLQVAERVARLRRDLEVEPVAEVGRVLREDAVAEEAEDGRVLALQLELELRLELVELVEMAHGVDSSNRRRSATGPRPGTTRSGSSSASGSSANARSCSRGCGIVSPGSSTTTPSTSRRSRSTVRGP